MVVVEAKKMNAELVRGYVREGYGIIQIPDLSALTKSSSDYFLTVVADEVQEFLRDKEQVTLLRGKADRWIDALLNELSKRKMSVETSGQVVFE